jgi:hypothetical protein
VTWTVIRFLHLIGMAFLVDGQIMLAGMAEGSGRRQHAHFARFTPLSRMRSCLPSATSGGAR